MQLTIPVALALAFAVSAQDNNDSSSSLLAIVQTMVNTDTGVTSSFIPVTTAAFSTTTGLDTTRNTIPLSVSTNVMPTNTIVQLGTSTALVIPGAQYFTTNMQGMTIIATASSSMTAAVPVSTATVTNTVTTGAGAAGAAGTSATAMPAAGDAGAVQVGFAAIPGVVAAMAGAVAFAL